MAVVLHTTGLAETRTSRSGTGRRTRTEPVRLVLAGVTSALLVLAVISGAWIALAIVAGLLVLGTSLLAGGDEPLSLRQVSSLGAIHLAAGLLLAL